MIAFLNVIFFCILRIKYIVIDYDYPDRSFYDFDTSMEVITDPFLTFSKTKVRLKGYYQYILGP
jgi:hypothetical protein